MKITSYNDAAKYLENFIGKIRFRIDPEFLKHHDPLTRMRVLLRLIGNPERKFPSVLVGGTAGKGSTAYLISHILTTAGYKTGLTLSPHLQKVNERLQINEEQISDEVFVKMLNLVVSSIEKMKRMSALLRPASLGFAGQVGAPSYFEILIAMAFKYFAEQKVDIAVVEVGMGGEFDATNTLYPLVSVLTNVSLDHTNVLGGTVQKIAKTKAGIIKGFSRCHPEFISGSPYIGKDEMLKQSMKQAQDMVQHDKKGNPIVVTGVKQASVIKIVEDRCREVGAKLYRLEKDFDFAIKGENIKGSIFDFYSHGIYSSSERSESRSFKNDSSRLTPLSGVRSNNKISYLHLSLLGKYQVENACLAIETVLRLGNFGFEVLQHHIRKALKTAFFPGRFENIQFQISNFKFQIVLDGAHNPTKMKAFIKTLKKLFPKQKKIFIVAFKKDKNVKGILRQILPVADYIVITEFRVKTDMAKNASAEAFNIKNQILKIKYDGEVVVEKDSKKALDKALAIEQFSNSTIIVVTGSLYLVGEVRNML